MGRLFAQHSSSLWKGGGSREGCRDVDGFGYSLVVFSL